MVAPLAAISGAAAAFGTAVIGVATSPVTLAVGAAVVVDQAVAYYNHDQSVLGSYIMGEEGDRTTLGKMWDAKVTLPIERNLAERSAEIDAAHQYQESRERLESAFPGAGEAKDIGNPFALEQ